MKLGIKKGKKSMFSIFTIIFTMICIVVAIISINYFKVSKVTEDESNMKGPNISENSTLTDSINNTGPQEKKSSDDADNKTTEIIAKSGSQTSKIDSEIIIPIKFAYEVNYWERYDLSNAVYKTQEEYEAAVIDYIVRISSLTEKPDWFNQYMGIGALELTLCIMEDNDFDGMSMLEGPKNDKTTCYGYKIYLSKSMFEHKNSALAEALSYMVNYNRNNKCDSFSQTLTTGLNQYIQYNLGDKIATCSFGVDIHNYLIEITKQNISDSKNANVINIAKKNIGGASGYYSSAGKIMPNAYQSIKLTRTSVSSNGSELASASTFGIKYNVLCSYSFVDYLIRTYGIEAFMTIYNAKDIKAYNEAYNNFHTNGIMGIREDWQKFLDDYSCKMKIDEIDQYIAKQRVELGY